MTASTSLAPLLWFAAIVLLIPLLLWLLKRTPLGGGGAAHGVLRHVAALPLSGTQRIVTVEVGQGDERRWLVLGVTPQTITTLHTMAAQAAAPAAGAQGTPGRAAPPFVDALARWRSRGAGDA